MQYSKQENEEFFKWLLDKNDINMECDIDYTCCSTQMDPNIYYPEELGNFFRTYPMQRINKILQLGCFINANSNTYHTRFEHCLGTFNQKKNIILRLYKDPKFKKYIEDNNLKIYLIAELIKSAGHDIGHLPLSHALETTVIGKHEFHEEIGKRILTENTEIQDCLTNISPDLPKALETVLHTDVFGFGLIDEGNYDIDRLDYLSRDNLYRGILIPNLEFMPFTLDLEKKIPVFDISAVSEIENFLNIRLEAYKNGYVHPLSSIQSSTVAESIKAFIEKKEPNGKKLQQFLIKLQSAASADDIDLDEYLYWNDLNFYTELLDVAEFSKDPHIRQLATLCIPNLDAFQTMVYTMCRLNRPTCSKLNKEELSLSSRIYSYKYSDSEVAENLKTLEYFSKNVFYCCDKKTVEQLKKDKNKNPLIFFGRTKITGYDPEKPIYIQNDGNIYTIDNTPGVKFSISSKPEYIEYVYCLLPLLELNGYGEADIPPGFFQASIHDLNFSHGSGPNMSPWQVGSTKGQGQAFKSSLALRGSSSPSGVKNTSQTTNRETR